MYPSIHNVHVAGFISGFSVRVGGGGGGANSPSLISEMHVCKYCMYMYTFVGILHSLYMLYIVCIFLSLTLQNRNRTKGCI